MLMRFNDLNSSVDLKYVLSTTPEQNFVFQGRKFELHKIVSVPTAGLKIGIDPTACSSLLYEPVTLKAATDQYKVIEYNTSTAFTGGTAWAARNVNDFFSAPSTVVKYGVTSAATEAADSKQYLVGTEGTNQFSGGGEGGGSNVHVHDPSKYLMIEIANGSGDAVDWEISMTWYE